MISSIGFCFGLNGYYKKVFLDVKLGMSLPSPALITLPVIATRNSEASLFLLMISH
jgi:hypothetical protein